jgi:hypothetical protein
MTGSRTQVPEPGRLLAYPGVSHAPVGSRGSDQARSAEFNLELEKAQRGVASTDGIVVYYKTLPAFRRGRVCPCYAAR